MTDAADARLQRLLGGDQLAALRHRLRRRFERADAQQTVGQLRITGLDAAEHAALAALVGRPQRLSDSLAIDVRLVDESLRRAGIADSLRDALERLDGPIIDLAALRQHRQAQWSAVLAGCRHDGLIDLLRSPLQLGLLKRLAKQDSAAAGRLCARAEAVLQRLPAGGLPRSQLAAEVLGDAHALDDGQPVATLVLAVQRRLAEPVEEVEAEMRPVGERARDVWAAVGVLVNELARPALFLNLPVEGQASHPSGEPGFLSLRALLRTPPRWNVDGREVHVCENPNLVAIAADRLGARCRPLVCTDGMPGAAQRALLTQLSRAGARLRYHGDFDWPGVTIANSVMRTFAAQAWRFGAVDYLAAIATQRERLPSLDGTPVIAAWDDALTAAMTRHGIPVPEEGLAESLLQDLNDR
jgi:uncharacterized protein (TIGR02679 family)